MILLFRLEFEHVVKRASASVCKRSGASRLPAFENEGLDDAVCGYLVGDSRGNPFNDCPNDAGGGVDDIVRLSVCHHLRQGD